MSLAGNNSNSGTSGRSSIFETFHTPNFGDETFDVQPVKVHSRPPQQELANALSGSRSMENPTSAHHPSADGPQRQEATTAEEEEEEEYALEEEEDVSSSENAETTLWMSCSPGRDLTDDEVDEEWGESTSQEMDEMNEEQELDDEGKSSENDDDDEDDGLPLSKLARKQFIEREPIHPNARHPKISRKTKRSTDKKASSKKQLPANSKKKKKLKLVKRSAYSFFYSDTQNAIKSQNPAATFGEISKIVASMWDHLGSDLKENYSRRAEEFNAQHKDEIMLAARSKPKKTKKSSSSSKSKHRTLDSETQSESLDSLEGPAFKGDGESKDESSDNVDSSSASFGDSGRSKPRKEDRLDKETKTKPLCNYTKCQNPAVDDPRWEYNYCSPQCVISHCKDVFKAWVANRKSAYCET